MVSTKIYQAMISSRHLFSSIISFAKKSFTNKRYLDNSYLQCTNEVNIILVNNNLFREIKVGI